LIEPTGGVNFVDKEIAASGIVEVSWSKRLTARECEDVLLIFLMPQRRERKQKE